MTVRLLAYAFWYNEHLSFGRGLSEVDEPALWEKSLDDRVLHWIEVGQPDADRITWCSRRTERTDGKVVAYFTDGTSVVGDVLVGADGANSRVRRQLVPHARWVDTGARRLAGKIELTEAIKQQVPELFYKKTL